MKAHRRPVSGCGSQRMLHALERRSHPADHGPSFASLYSPFCRYATSSPDRGKSLLAGGGQLSCNSRTGQIKNALARMRKGVFMTRTGIEQGGGAKHRNQSPGGALVSPGVPTARNVYRGCCWKTPSVFASQIHLPQRGRLLGRKAKLCHLNNTASAEPCASVHGSAGAVCHLIGCFPECKPRCPPARRPGRPPRRRSALRGRGSPTGPP